MKPCALPRVLLVEDDPVSRAFLEEAVAPVARVAARDSAGSALQAARASPGFDLWLLDAHLPDADGPGLRLGTARIHSENRPPTDRPGAGSAQTGDTR